MTSVSNVLAIRPECGEAMPEFPGPALLLGTSLTLSVSGPSIVACMASLFNPTKSRMRCSVGVLRTAVVKDDAVVSINTARRPIAYVVDLAPAGIRQLKGGISLTACSSSVPSRTPKLSKTPVEERGPRLPTGDYKYYAWTPAVWNSEGTDVSIAWGGPWDLAIAN